MNRKRKQSLSLIICLLFFIVCACFNYYKLKVPFLEAVNLGNSRLDVHFIDVGQGDSILIASNQHYMLIDAGEDDKGDNVVNYLKRQGVTKLDYVIASHPHSDHIGGLDTVIESFDIDTIIMPDVTSSTENFANLLSAIKKTNHRITKAIVGSVYRIGSGYFVILSPGNVGYTDMNDYSVVIKLVNGNNSFLLTGDAEVPAEKDMLRSNYDLSCDVLKLAHHGSSSSCSSSFLDAVNPTYAVISVGADNSYNHPTKKVLNAINKRKIKIYRTDKQGSIVFTSNGHHLLIHTSS